MARGRYVSRRRLHCESAKDILAVYQWIYHRLQTIAIGRKMAYRYKDFVTGDRPSSTLDIIPPPNHSSKEINISCHVEFNIFVLWLGNQTVWTLTFWSRNFPITLIVINLHVNGRSIHLLRDGIWNPQCIRFTVNDSVFWWEVKKPSRKLIESG